MLSLYSAILPEKYKKNASLVNIFLVLLFNEMEYVRPIFS